MRESPIACNMAAFDAAQRERHGALMEHLRSATQEVRELPNGYSLRLPPEQSMCLAVAEFITLERLCCPFLSFALEVEREGGPLWLRMTGRDGVKQLLKAELGLS
ncbi:MAG: hypothetical protein V3U26_00570 [Dehalococcoidia bacterium]